MSNLALDLMASRRLTIAPKWMAFQREQMQRDIAARLIAGAY